MRFAPGPPPKPLRMILDGPRPSLGKTRVVSFAMQEFHRNRMLRHACLFRGANISINYHGLTISWRQKWGKPRSRLRVQIAFDYHGGISVWGCLGGRKLRLKGWALDLNRQRLRSIDAVLAFRLSDEMLVPVRWATIRDFILDPARFE